MLHQDIIRTEAAKAIAHERELVVLDPWTTRGVPHQSSRGTRRTRKQPDPTRLFARNIRDLAKLDTLWLTNGETHWLDGDRKVIVEMPQTHFCSHNCKFRNKKVPQHEAAARHEPERHGRFNGSITLVKTGARTMVATVRLAKGLHSAATIQMRTDPKPGNKTLRAKIRLLSYLGEREEIALGLSALTSFLSQRDYVEQAFRQAAKGEKNHHPSYHPMLMEGRRNSTLDVYNKAGMPGSPERKLWADAAAANVHGIAVTRSWVQRELKPY